VAPLPVPSYVVRTDGERPLDQFCVVLGWLPVAVPGSDLGDDQWCLTWKKVTTPGIWPTYSINGNVMFVTSDVCAKPIPENPSQCASELSQYRVGSASPIRNVTIPDIGAGKWRAAQVLDALTSRAVVVVEDVASHARRYW